MTTDAWGLYPWFPEHGFDLIHPDDREAVKASFPYGKVWHVIGGDGDYLLLAASTWQFRAKPALFESVSPPKFPYGARVRTRPPRTVRECVVVGIGWHNKRQESYYLLEENGKRLSRRYWAAELEAMDY
jgi:Family of unknown function (DUF6960)